MAYSSKRTVKTQPDSVKDRHQFIARILCRPLIQIMADYRDEIRAKDQAYRFILKEGLLDRFQEYCRSDSPDQLT